MCPNSRTSSPRTGTPDDALFLARDGRHAVPAPSPRLRRRTSLRAGFTLIEILVVIVVIAILATLVAPNIFQHVGAAKDATAKSQIEMLGAALDAYRLDNGRYPTTEQGARRPVGEADGRRAGQLARAVSRGSRCRSDPWGRPYIYTSPGQVNPQGYDLLSYGADGKPGGENEDADILSWK